MRVRQQLVAALAAAGCLVAAGGANAQIRDDQEALKALQVPKGFEVRLFAGSDLVHNPTAIDVDVYGRVWVAEGVNYRSSFNPGPGPLDPQADRIKVLEDTDGDGRADKVTVFADKIPIVPMSVCVAGDQVYVGVAPEFWRFDGAEAKQPVGKNRTVVLNGFSRGGRGRPGQYADHDHALHGLLLGPDGRMHFTVGDVGMDVTDNSGKQHRPNGACMVRMNLDGTALRVLADNFRNPYESCVDSFGRTFCSDNDDDGNAQVRICYVIDGGDYGYRHNPKLPASPTRHHWHEDVPGVTPKILRTFAGSPCGILVYEGGLLPDRFRGSLVHCDSGAPQAVRAYHLKPNGAGFDCETENLVTSTDRWFRPVDVAHAPDGSLYFADWYDPGVGGHAYRDKVLGRVYHLTKKGAPPPSRVAAPDLKTVPGLLASLMSPMPSVRFLAVRGLQLRGEEAVAALSRLAREGKHPLERARALWVLFGMGDAGQAVIRERLQDRDPLFRALAVRMLREDVSRNLDALLPLAGDDHPEVRLELAVALRDAPTDQAGDALLRLARAGDPGDPWYAPTLGGALRKREPAFVRKLFEGITSKEQEARALTLAWQINRPESVPFLAGVLKSPRANGHFQRALDALGWIPDLSAGEAVAAVAADDSDPARRRPALETLRRRIGSDWRALLDRPVFAKIFQRSQDDPASLSLTLTLIGTAQARNYVPEVLKLVKRPDLDKALRRAALEALGQIRTPETLAVLTETLRKARLPDETPSNPPPTDELALASLSALQAMETPEARKALQSVIEDRRYPSDLRRQAVKGLGRSPAGGQFLLNLAERDRLPVELKGDAAEVTNRSPDRKVRDRAARVLPLPKLAGNRTLPPLHEILGRGGDAKRGQAVFFKEQAQCAKCHRVAGVGSWVGPDLSQVGGKLGKDALLDAILNPSAGIAHEYVQFVVETEKGQVYNGLVVEESPERLVLKNAEGERIALPAGEVAGKKPSPVSIMPEGLVQHLTDQDLCDLLAFLGTLKQPAVAVTEWLAAGPLPPEAGTKPPAGGIDPKATFPGKGGTPVGWRKLTADREGRLDLEAALGTREASVLLYAPLQSKASQAGRVVVLLPKGARAAGWLNGKEIQVTPLPAAADKTQVPMAAPLDLRAGKNELVLRLVGSDQAALTAVTTVVTPQGVEVQASGR